MRRKILAVGVGGILLGVGFFVWKSRPVPPDIFVNDQNDPAAKLSSSRGGAATEPSLPSIAGLDLLRIGMDDKGAAAPAS